MQNVVYQRFLTSLAQLAWREIALSLGTGTLGGIFPIPLFTAFITAILGRFFNVSEAQKVVSAAINFVTVPVQLYLIPFFARYGAEFLNQDPNKYSVQELKTSLNKGVDQFMGTSGKMLILSALGWACIAIPLLVFGRLLRLLHIL